MEFMEPWMWWFIAFLALLIIDLLVIGGSGGFLLALAVMAAGGLVATLFGASFTGQLLTAIITGLLALPLLLWAFARMAKGRAGDSHGDDPRLAEPVEVVEKNGTLGVTFLGDFFPAQHAERAALNPGDVVVIERFQGITAVVRPAGEAAGSSAGSSL